MSELRRMRFKTSASDILPYSDDIDRMIRVARENDVELSETDAYDAWTAYSESFAAGWMELPESDYKLWTYLFNYLEDC